MKSYLKKFFNSNLRKIISFLIVCITFFVLIQYFRNYKIHKQEKEKLEQQKTNYNKNKENQKMKEEKERNKDTEIEEKKSNIEDKKIDIDENEIDNFNEKKPK